MYLSRLSREHVRRYFDASRYANYGYLWDAELAFYATSEALYRLLLAVHAVTPPSYMRTNAPILTKLQIWFEIVNIRVPSYTRSELHRD
jgi:hypothetical protein